MSQKLRGAAVSDNAGAKEVEEKLHPRDNESPVDEKDQEVADGSGLVVGLGSGQRAFGT